MIWRIAVTTALLASAGLSPIVASAQARARGPSPSRQELVERIRERFQNRIARELRLDDEQREALGDVFPVFARSRAELLPRRREIERRISDHLAGPDGTEEDALGLLERCARSGSARRRCSGKRRTGCSRSSRPPRCFASRPCGTSSVTRSGGCAVTPARGTRETGRCADHRRAGARAADGSDGRTAGAVPPAPDPFRRRCGGDPRPGVEPLPACGTDRQMTRSPGGRLRRLQLPRPAVFRVPPKRSRPPLTPRKGPDRLRRPCTGEPPAGGAG